MRFIYLLELQNKDCFSPLSIVTGLVHPQSQSLAEPYRRRGGGLRVTEIESHIMFSEACLVTMASDHVGGSVQ